jgi:hypothetical protein
MRREYDFSKGTRGKHVAKRIRIIGDAHHHNGPDTAAKIQKVIERDLKGREDFKSVWNELERAQKESIRAAWLEKIQAVLANQ